MTIKDMKQAVKLLSKEWNLVKKRQEQMMIFVLGYIY